jgi:hypothetical protein
LYRVDRVPKQGRRVIERRTGQKRDQISPLRGLR